MVDDEKERGKKIGEGKIMFQPFRKALHRKRRDKPFTWDVKKTDRCRIKV